MRLPGSAERSIHSTGLGAAACPAPAPRAPRPPIHRPRARAPARPLHPRAAAGAREPRPVGAPASPPRALWPAPPTPGRRLPDAARRRRLLLQAGERRRGNGPLLRRRARPRAGSTHCQPRRAFQRVPWRGPSPTRCDRTRRSPRPREPAPKLIARRTSARPRRAGDPGSQIGSAAWHMFELGGHRYLDVTRQIRRLGCRVGRHCTSNTSITLPGMRPANPYPDSTINVPPHAKGPAPPPIEPPCADPPPTVATV